METLIKSPLIKDISPEWIQDFSKAKIEPAWVLSLRLKAFAQYQSLAWPTQRDERWKRTELNLLEWNKLSFIPTESSHSKENAKSSGEWVLLDEAIVKNQKVVEAAWESGIVKAKGNKFLSLTLALGNGGYCLFTPKNTKLDPAHIDFGFKPGEHTAQFPLSFLFIEEGSEIQIWEDLSTDDSAGSAQTINFVSSYVSIHLKENAQASFYHLQHWNDKTIHFQFQDTTQEANSKLNAVAVGVGGRIFHNELTIHLNGQHAENKVLGVLFGDEKQIFEHWITQNHNAKKTTSDIQYRGALKGSSKSFFSGLVSIVKEAQQSDAYQSAKSLLLSNEARADAIPNLEILADDVKCSHGAAVGPVDEDQKYYLGTRGIPPAEAEELIIQGFFEPVISAVPSEPVQDQLRTFIENKLKK